MGKKTWLFLAVTSVTTAAYVIRRDVTTTLPYGQTLTTSEPHWPIEAGLENTRTHGDGASLWTTLSPQHQDDQGELLRPHNNSRDMTRESDGDLSLQRLLNSTSSILNAVGNNETEKTLEVVTEVRADRTSGGSHVNVNVLVPVLCVVVFLAFLSLMVYLLCWFYKDERGKGLERTRMELVPMGQFHHDFFVTGDQFLPERYRI